MAKSASRRWRVTVAVFAVMACGLALTASAPPTQLARTQSRPPAPATPRSIDAAFAAYWSATTIAEATVAAAAVVSSGVDFPTALARLRQGKTYDRTAPTGVVRRERRAGGLVFPYSVDVPVAYDPARRYQVRVQLHGGVGRPAATIRGDGSIGTLAGAEQIYVLPQAWAQAQWWEAAQDDNLAAILDDVKRTWNVDENRVVLSGVSDGGTGAFYVAMRHTTPYASFLPLNGFVMVLRNRDLGIDGALFPHNLVNKPMLAVNGGRDPLYPAARVEPYLTQFKAGGLDLVYLPQPEAGHNTAWWPTVKDDVEGFVAAHPRQPHPARLTWQTDAVATHNRAHWLVIDRLASAPAALPAPAPGTELPDLNLFVTGEEPNFGVRAEGMRVTAVLPGSNAQAIGFAVGDVVTRINGRELPGALALTDFLGIYAAGEALSFDVTRAAASVTLSGRYEPTVRPKVTPLFPVPPSAGRVDVVRDGNTITATSRGVAGFTLLLSPDVIDFARPVTVVANGRTVYSARVTASVETLLTWAARDNDRTMIYGAALPISVR